MPGGADFSGSLEVPNLLQCLHPVHLHAGALMVSSFGEKGGSWTTRVASTTATSSSAATSVKRIWRWSNSESSSGLTDFWTIRSWESRRKFLRGSFERCARGTIHSRTLWTNLTASLLIGWATRQIKNRLKSSLAKVNRKDCSFKSGRKSDKSENAENGTLLQTASAMGKKEHVRLLLDYGWVNMEIWK